MPTYEFIADDGEVIEQVHSIKNIPQQVEVNGKVYKLTAFSRGNTSAVADAQVATTVHGYPHVEYTLPKGDLGHGTDRDGRPIIKSQHHEREIIRKSEGRITGRD